MTSWNPNVNGIVNGIGFSPDCSTAYIGGKFTTVGGMAVKNIAAVSTSTGALIPAFGHSASGQVETLQYVNGHILVGGYFTTINNSGANPYFASLNPTTGKDDGFLHLGISGNYEFPGCRPTRPGSTTSSSATAARWTWSRATSPRSAGRPGSRCSC